jgi:hypothetical protein
MELNISNKNLKLVSQLSVRFDEYIELINIKLRIMLFFSNKKLGIRLKDRLIWKSISLSSSEDPIEGRALHRLTQHKNC